MAQERIQKTERGGLRFQRKERGSVADLSRKVLNLPDIPDGLVGRVVNDAEDRVERMKQRGYMPYEVKEGAETNSTQQTTTLGSVWNKSVGGGMRGVLMVIPKEWYDEDQAVKLEASKQVEAQLKRKAETDGLSSDLGPGRGLTGISIKH